MTSPRWLIEVAASIADGATIDWDAVDARARDSVERELVARLRVLERLTRGHLTEEGGGSSTMVSAVTDDDGPPLAAWGPFTIVERVGRGTFGDVYRAQDPHLDRLVALKLLRHKGPSETTADSKIVEEARMMARVRHPNAVTVYGAERIDGRVGVWMEFLEGRTLEEELQVCGPFASQAIVQIGRDLCGALSAVHDAGFLHRDVKTQNVIRESNTGRVVLTDFGAGRERGADANLPSELAGTPVYLAPEVLVGGAASPQSDIYSLGVLLYRLATGSFPVRGRTLRDLRDAHERRASKRDSRVASTLQPRLMAVVEKAIAPDPAERYQSATDVAHALQKAASARTPLVRATFAAAALLAIGVSVTLVVMRGHSAPDFRQVRWHGEDTVGNPSPDGMWSICVNPQGRVSRCHFGTSKAEPITGLWSVRGMGALLSSDGRRVAYVRQMPNLELRTAAIDGTDEQTLHRFQPGQTVCSLDAWSWEGSALAGCMTTSDGTSQILLITGPPWNVRQWTVGGQRPGKVSLAPDGNMLVYDVQAVANERRNGDIFAIDLRAGTERPLVREPTDDVAPVWSRSDGSVLFVRNHNGAWEVMKVSIDERSSQPPSFVGSLGSARSVAVRGSSNDEVLYELLGPREVRTLNLDWALARAIEMPASDPSAVPMIGFAPDWSQDGQALAYLPRDERSWEGRPTGRISIVDAEREQQLASIYVTIEQVPDDRTNHVFLGVSIRWAPNSQRLVVCCDVPNSRVFNGRMEPGFALTARQVWLVDLASRGVPPRITPVDFDTRREVTSVAFDRASDTRLYFSAIDGIWMRDLQAGTERRVYTTNSENPFREFDFSPDGQQLILVSNPGERRQYVRVVTLRDGSERILYETDQTIHSPGMVTIGEMSGSIVFLETRERSLNDAARAEVPPLWDVVKVSISDGKTSRVSLRDRNVTQIRSKTPGATESRM